MAKVLEERAEVAAIKSDYKYGFHDPDQSVFRARKGLDRGIVEQISEMKGEPHWMRDIRLHAFDIFRRSPCRNGVASSRRSISTTSITTSSRLARGGRGKTCRKTSKTPLTAWAFQKPSVDSWLALARSTTQRWCIIALAPKTRRHLPVPRSGLAGIS